MGHWCSGKCRTGPSGTWIAGAAFPMENCEPSESQPPLKGKIYMPTRLKLALETDSGKCASSDENPSYLPRDDNKSLVKFYSTANRKDLAWWHTWVGFQQGDIMLLAQGPWPPRMAALWHDKCRPQPHILPADSRGRMQNLQKLNFQPKISRW